MVKLKKIILGYFLGVAICGQTLAALPAYLENPSNGAKVSGIGLVSGWACDSANVEVSFNGGDRIRAPSGGSRADTFSVCGRSDTGFGLTFAYNLLGNGTHTAQLYVSGVAVGGPIYFTVTVPAGEFIRGQAKTVLVPDFPSPGAITQLEWQESSQNFVISGVGSNLPVSLPTVKLSLSNPKTKIGSNTMLTWESSSSTSCTGVEGINGFLPIKGSIEIRPTASGQFRYSLACSGPGGSQTQTVTLIVPIPVQATSYLNAKNLNIPPQRYPAFNQLEHNGSYSDYLGPAVAFGDFFQEGKISMVWFTNRTNYRQPAEPMPPGTIKFFKFDANGLPVEHTSSVLTDLTSCIAPNKLLVADFNGDGQPDIYVACTGPEWGDPWPGDKQRILLSQPDGTYKNVQINLNCYCHAAAAADLNGDGHVDVLTSDWRVSFAGSDVINDRTSMILLVNDGKGNFTVNRNYDGVPLTMTAVVANYTVKTATPSMELVDVNGDGKPDLILGTGIDREFPTSIYLNRNNRFEYIDVRMPTGIEGYWSLDMVVRNSKVYLYGIKNYATTFDEISIYRYDLLTRSGEVIYNSKGMRWPSAPTPHDWVWIMPYNGNIVPLTDSITGVSVPM